MSRFSCDDYEEYFPNQGDLWRANAERALSGKRGRKALRELREALLALPEKRLIASALCTVGGVAARRNPIDPTTNWQHWYNEDLGEVVEREGEGVCAIGAFLWFKRVKAGEDPQEAFLALPTLLAVDGGDYETAEAGKRAGLTGVLAWTLAYRNDEAFADMTPEERYKAFMRWLDEQLEPDTAEAAA